MHRYIQIFSQKTQWSGLGSYLDTQRLAVALTNVADVGSQNCCDAIVFTNAYIHVCLTAILG